MSASEILEQLGRDARKLRVGQRLPDGPITWEVAQRVQADFRFMLEQPGITIDLVARAMGDGFSRGTLSKFRNAESAEGIDLNRVVRGINQFMETIARRRQAKMPDGWVETRVARKALLVIAKTIELAAIGLIYGDAGRGKSLAKQAAKEIHPGAILVRVRQSTRTPTGLVKQLAATLNLRCCDTGYRAQAKVIDTLRGTGRALLVDEAHQLRHEAMEFLRDLHDECGVPIVLAGTVKLNEAVADTDLFFGQFASRVALRYNITADIAGDAAGDDPDPLHTVDEIKSLYERDRVRFTDEGRILLTKIANLPGLGGLRLCTKVAQVAGRLCDGEAVTAELILQVIRSMHGLAYAVDHVERSIERSRVRVA